MSHNPAYDVRMALESIPPYDPVPVLCEYWLMCLNTTLRATRHPILGSVPTCERCEAAHIALGGNPGFVIGLEDES